MNVLFIWKFGAKPVSAVWCQRMSGKPSYMARFWLVLSCVTEKSWIRSLSLYTYSDFKESTIRQDLHYIEYFIFDIFIFPLVLVSPLQIKTQILTYLDKSEGEVDSGLPSWALVKRHPPIINHSRERTVVLVLMIDCICLSWKGGQVS